jgi:hypothetical protein
MKGTPSGGVALDEGGGHDEGGNDGKGVAKSLQERIEAFRASDKFDLALNPISEELEKTLKRKGRGDQRWSDSSKDPETSLFGFARMPSFSEAVSAKCISQMKMELEDRSDAVALLRPDMLALGQVVEVLGDSLQVRLERVAEWLPREGCARTIRRLPEALSTLDIRGSVPASELRDALSADQLPKALNYFRPGDSLVMVITKVEAHCDYIGLSMRQSRIHERLSRVIVLGKCDDVKHIHSTWGPGSSRVDGRFTRDFEAALSRASVGSHPSSHSSEPNNAASHPSSTNAPPSRTRLDLNEVLHADALFWNPYALDNMMESYCISQYAKMFGCKRRPAALRGYLQLRRLQNSAWACDSVSIKALLRLC